MRFDANDLDDLKPLIDVIITSTVERLRADDAKLGQVGAQQIGSRSLNRD